MRENNLKSVNIWQSYKQQRDCLRLLAVRWPGAQSARDNHVLACGEGAQDVQRKMGRTVVKSDGEMSWKSSSSSFICTVCRNEQ